MKPLFFHLNNPWQLNKNRWLVKEYRIVGTLPFSKEDHIERMTNGNVPNCNLDESDHSRCSTASCNLNCNTTNCSINCNNLNCKTVSFNTTNCNTASYNSKYALNPFLSISDLTHIPFFYLVEFPSGRLNVGYFHELPEPNESVEMKQVWAAHAIYLSQQFTGKIINDSTSSSSTSSSSAGNELTNKTKTTKSLLYQFVMIEADRGLDCGRIISLVDSKEYQQLLLRIDKNLLNKELHPKRIYRLAENKELIKMLVKKEQEVSALRDCQLRVTYSNLDMSVTCCEYQFDMNKMTFFFESEGKIDFRELVKGLFKIFKVRIWMCAVEKSKNHYLKELVKK